MIPHLKPDIYNVIADHLAPVTRKSVHHENLAKEIISAQADLLNMGKASKVRLGGYDLHTCELT
jgi:hypothetical protein